MGRWIGSGIYKKGFNIFEKIVQSIKEDTLIYLFRVRKRAPNRGNR